MDDSPSEVAAAAHSQVHGWSSYSLPSQPPDIRNWFASYEYESPEDSELVADPGAHNGSETQGPFEHPIFPRGNGIAVRKNRLSSQSEKENLERRDLILADESTVKNLPKKKQSLRALFDFLDKHEEATESEYQVALPVQRNAPEPLPICNETGLLDAKQSEEGTSKCGELPVDCNDISSLDTQVSSPVDQELEYSKLPVIFGASLADNRKCFPIDSIDSVEPRKTLVENKGIGSVETQVSFPADQELEYCKLPFNCVSSSLAEMQKCLTENSSDSIEHGKVLVDSDGISSIDTQVSSLADQEVECRKLPVTTVFSGLADSIQQEDGVGSSEMAMHFFGTKPANTGKGYRDGSEDNISEDNILPIRPARTILADTKENSPVKEVGHCKPASDSKGSEQTVASDGFVAIKRKHNLPEECKRNKIPKYPMGRDKGTLQENRNVLGQKILGQVHTRCPLADKTNFTEAAAAPTVEFSGKWKCPSKGKPHIGPPMKQLRLDQWLR